MMLVDVGVRRKSSVICENRLTASKSRINDVDTIIRTASVTQEFASGIVKHVHIAAISETKTGSLTWVFTTAHTLCQEKTLRS